MYSRSNLSQNIIDGPHCLWKLLEMVTYEDVTQVPFLYVVEAELILSLLVQGSFLNCTTENKENTEKIMITH